jgi:hypothetical protein
MHTHIFLTLFWLQKQEKKKRKKKETKNKMSVLVFACMSEVFRILVSVFFASYSWFFFSFASIMSRKANQVRIWYIKFSRNNDTVWLNQKKIPNPSWQHTHIECHWVDKKIFHEQLLNLLPLILHVCLRTTIKLMIMNIYNQQICHQIIKQQLIRRISHF